MTPKSHPEHFSPPIMILTGRKRDAVIRMRHLVKITCLLAVFLVAGLLGCGEVRPPVRNSAITDSNLPPSFLIEGVPWYRQDGNQCGPTSLAMVLNYYGMKVTKDDIVKWVMSVGLLGTPLEELEYYAGTQKGCKVYRFYDGTKGKTRVKGLIAQGYPLIAIGRIPTRWHSRSKLWEGHAVVVVGYDDVGGNFIIQDPAWGREGREQTKVPYGVFEDFLFRPTLPNMLLCIYPSREFGTAAE